MLDRCLKNDNQIEFVSYPSVTNSHAKNKDVTRIFQPYRVNGKQRLFKCMSIITNNYSSSAFEKRQIFLGRVIN